MPSNEEKVRTSKRQKDAKEQANNIRSKKRMGFIVAYQSKGEAIKPVEKEA